MEISICQHVAKYKSHCPTCYITVKPPEIMRDYMCAQTTNMIILADTSRS